MSKYFPLFVDLSEKKVVVVGGGKIAARRVKTIVSFCNHLVIVSPELCEELADFLADHEEHDITDLHDSGDFGSEGKKGRSIVWIQEKYSRERILDADLVLACTDDYAVNKDIHAACKCLGIPVNICNDRTKCDFYFPGIIERENVVIGITASGENHKEAKAVRKKIEQALLQGEAQDGFENKAAHIGKQAEDGELS